VILPCFEAFLSSRAGQIDDEDRPFVEALLLLALHRITKTTDRHVQMTDGQWCEAVHRLTGRRPEPEQLRQAKDRFVTRREGSRNAQATKLELLREVRKGQLGFPSRYDLMALGEAFDTVSLRALATTPPLAKSKLAVS
jgi:hypothetical protein